MDSARISLLRAQYHSALYDDLLPFWMTRSLDREKGGYLHCLDREGSVYSTDKAVWLQCRQVWMLSKLYNTIEKREEWLEAARLGAEFVRRHAFDKDGRMFFSLTREGKPLRKRRYIFSEAFAVIAFAEFAAASGEERYLKRAMEIYRLMLRLAATPGLLPPKIIPSTRKMKSLAVPMIILAATQELRGHLGDSLLERTAAACVEEIAGHFLKPERRALLEHAGPKGQELDIPAGRLVNPGHAIETAWFLMHEAEHRSDAELREQACRILDWSLELGWDREHGGIFAFVDREGKPCEQLEWDMKLWWPHTEALYALLLAHRLTGDDRYADWHARVHEYAFARFPDPEFGEWFGYLHRDGSVANTLKGSMWKGFFHIPRALWMCERLLERMETP